LAGRPTVRRAEVPGGNRMAREANGGAPKGDRKPRAAQTTPSAVVASG
jgi:hypothetical protein